MRRGQLAKGILFSLVLIAFSFRIVQANWVVMPQTPNTDTPTVIIQSPSNNITYSNDFKLNFSLIKPDSWTPSGKPYGGIRSIIYMLDGREHPVYEAKNQVPFDELEPYNNFSIPIDEDISNGTHSIEITVTSATIYWEFPTPPPNSHGWGSLPIIHEYFTNVSETVTFTIDKQTEPSHSPTKEPTPSSDPTTDLSPTQQPTTPPSPLPSSSSIQQQINLPTETLTPPHSPSLNQGLDDSTIIGIIGLSVLAVAVAVLFVLKKKQNRI